MLKSPMPQHALVLPGADLILQALQVILGGSMPFEAAVAHGQLLQIEGPELAIKGHRLQGGVVARSTNWVKLATVSEEAIQKLEGKTELLGTKDFYVQRVVSKREVGKQTETEVVVVDSAWLGLGPGVCHRSTGEGG
ncbi:hypothetical protein CYMTET_29585 [Cymbomonas tetramitiformis]|uniref:Uncharacterized protein n=1 Tax=Cymbomonas tetramitiformis TaxID=36881 RepID=A0AAE0FKG2_9CHLO|nr:hypothetical protein CYMTET_29585 [Cymbomonas tetramitiformis]